MALEIPCPYCGTQMYAEQAHNRCPACLYIEPCCDGAPQARLRDAGARTPVEVTAPADPSGASAATASQTGRVPAPDLVGRSGTGTALRHSTGGVSLGGGARVVPGSPSSEGPSSHVERQGR